MPETATFAASGQVSCEDSGPVGHDACVQVFEDVVGKIGGLKGQGAAQARSTSTILPEFELALLVLLHHASRLIRRASGLARLSETTRRVLGLIEEGSWVVRSIETDDGNEGIL